jgi:predicted ATPase
MQLAQARLTLLTTADPGAAPVLGNLPTSVSSFVGRARERREIGGLLDNARIVTLTGLGGVGKTRLALAVAADLSSRFRYGVWMVDLAPIRDPHVVDSAVAAALGIAPPKGDLVETLQRFLGTKELLLVLDSCEHLLRPVADLVHRLELRCPQLSVLSTSREALGIVGERIVSVSPLGLPASSDRAGVLGSDACQLFLDRATAVRSGFAVSDGNAAAIAEVVRRLDGIPLALELAAARVPVLSPAQIAQRLGQRFRLLADGGRGSPERHATLQAAIDWSYDLLSKDQQLLLARLSVFAGGCTFQAVEAVCAGDGIDQSDVLDLLSALVARSLVVVSDHALSDDLADGQRRYRLLETMREYAEKHLDETDRAEVWDRHVGFYAEFLETAASGLRGSDEVAWLVRVEAELENLRVAMARAVEAQDAIRAERLVWAAAQSERGPVTAALLRDTDAVLRLPGIEDIPRYAYALTASAIAALFHGEWKHAEELCRRAVRAAGEDNEEVHGWVANVRAAIARMYDGAEDPSPVAQQERALDCFRRGGDPYHIVRALNVLVAFRAGTPSAISALAEVDEAVALARPTGNPGLLSAALAARAAVLADSEPDRSRSLIAESLDLADRRGCIAVNEQALLFNVVTMARLGERHTVLQRSAPALDRGFSGGFRLCVCLDSVASALAPEAPDAAATLLGYIDAVIPHHQRGDPQSGIRAVTNAAIAAQVDPDRIRELQTRGAALSESAATELALDAIARVLATTERQPTMRRRGRTWELCYGTQTCTIPDSKGWRDLATLLSRPGRDVHALELAGSGLRDGSPIEMADKAALAQYRQRIADIEDDIDEAERNHDSERLVYAEREREAIIRELRTITALGGKARLSGAQAGERARKAVAARIRVAIRQLDTSMPALAAHLDEAIVTGISCRYRAEIAENWVVET